MIKSIERDCIHLQVPATLVVAALDLQVPGGVVTAFFLIAALKQGSNNKKAQKYRFWQPSHSILAAGLDWTFGDMIRYLDPGLEICP